MPGSSACRVQGECEARSWLSGHVYGRQDGFGVLKVGEESVPCPEGNASWAPQSRQGTTYPVAAASVGPFIGMEPGE